MLCVSPAYAINFGEDAFDRTNRVTTARENGFFDKDFVKPSVDLEKFGHREDITVMHEGISSAIDKFKSDISDAAGSPEQVKQAVQTLSQTIKDLVSAFRPDKAVKEAAQSVKPAHSGITFMYDVYQRKGHDRPKESKTDVTKPVVGGTPQSCGYSWDEELQGWVGPSDDSPFVPAGEKPEWDKFIPGGDKDTDHFTHEEYGKAPSFDMDSLREKFAKAPLFDMDSLREKFAKASSFDLEWDKFIPGGDKDTDGSTMHDGISAAIDKFRSDMADAFGSPEQMKEAVQTLVQAIHNLIGTFHPDRAGEHAPKLGKSRSIVDVTISEAATEDGNVRSARVVERGDTVYGVVRYDMPSLGGGFLLGFLGNSRVEFTGIEAEDIESAVLNYDEGKLQFEVTKTDGTVVVFDVPERKAHGGHLISKRDGDGDTGGFTPPDMSAYTDSASLIKQAWTKFDAKKDDLAKSFTGEIITRYSEKASEQQGSLQDFAPSSTAAEYWALNDVGTAHYIQGKIFIREKDYAKAKEEFRKIIDEYGFAQAWDTQGWFWKVAEAAQKDLDDLS